MCYIPKRNTLFRLYKNKLMFSVLVQCISLLPFDELFSVIGKLILKEKIVSFTFSLQYTIPGPVTSLVSIVLIRKTNILLRASFNHMRFYDFWLGKKNFVLSNWKKIVKSHVDKYLDTTSGVLKPANLFTGITILTQAKIISL